MDSGLRVRQMVLPDIWMEQAKPEVMYAKAGLDRDGIVDTVFRALGRSGISTGTTG